MKKLLKIILILTLITNSVFASNIFDYPSDTKTIITSIPCFDNIKCNFVQTKTVPNSPVILKSGGNFVFEKNKGVTFYTTYPVKMTTSYTKSDNAQINQIITDIINKKYSSLEKNFKLYYKNSNNWELGLIPKNPQIKKHIKTVYVSGNKHINFIEIINEDNTKTKINFKVS